MSGISWVRVLDDRPVIHIEPRHDVHVAVSVGGEERVLRLHYWQSLPLCSPSQFNRFFPIRTEIKNA